MRGNRNLVWALAAFCVAAAGCGGKPFPSSAGTANASFVSAVDKTAHAKTARVALDLSGSSSAGNETVSETGDGVIDFTSHVLQLTVKLKVGGLDFNVEVRELGGKIYTRSSGSGESGPWRSVNAVSSTGAASENSFDPRQFMSFLRGVGGDVQTVGKERVRDADTTHYHATIDPALLAARAASSEDRTAASVARNVFGSMKSVPVDVWIDGQNRVRKFDMAVTFNGASSVAAGTTAKLTMEFYDFGTPVHVEAPAGAIDAGSATQDRAAQSDLRNALTAEKVVYTDNQEYDSSPEHMRTIEPSLNWGGKVTTYVGNATSLNDIVCLQETSASGTIFSIADVADGPFAGTYFGTRACPVPLTGQKAAALGRSWPIAADDGAVSGSDGSSDGSSSDGNASSETLTPSGEGQVKAELRNALAAEMTTFTDTEAYDASPEHMRAIESSIDWGGKLHVAVGDAVSAGDNAVVCMSEAVPGGGGVLAIADVASGPYAGTYYGHAPCGDHPSAAIAKLFKNQW